MTTIFHKYLLDRFQEYIYQEYLSYCIKHELAASDKGFLTFLIDKKIIPIKEIKQYTILQEFHEVYPKNEFHKTNTVLSLADKYHISERSVWSILKK